MIGKLKKRKPAEGKAARKRPARRYKSARSGRGTLLILALFLVGSAALRVGDQYGAAIALEGETEEMTETAKAVPNIDAILEELERREARIAEREVELDTRGEALALAETRIEEMLAELETAEEELRSTIALAETASEDDLAQLTSVYENMGADEAAALFSQMTPNFAAGFLGRMRPDVAAAILAGLDPNTAFEISVVLAGRNARVPTE